MDSTVGQSARRAGSDVGGGPEGWATRQLAEFLALISSLDDERLATLRATERAAAVLDADAAALVEADELVVSVGFAGEQAPPIAQLLEAASRAATTVELPGVGPSHACVVAVDEDCDRRLLVVRRTPLDREETDLLRGMGRVLALGTRTLRALGVERGLRAESERQAGENARLLVAVRERQGLLERLATVQRAIVARRSLHEVFEEIAAAARELTGDDASALRMRDRERGVERTSLVATSGLSEATLNARRRSEVPGLGARAMLEGRVVVTDARSRDAALPAEWTNEGLRAGMAAPVFDRTEVVGSLVIGSRRPGREYGARDRQILLALAEHASLALNHSHALDEAAHEALHDGLTGMANRALFLDRARQALARARRSRTPLVVLFIDLDDFKTVNDSLGHGTGDTLLVAVANRLAGALRPSDTIARLGGDEFAILVEDLVDPGDAARAAQRVMESLEQPFDVIGREVYVSASIGIAAGLSDGELLLRDADLAMYRAKESGKGRYEVFEPAMHAAIVDRLELEVDLRRGIERGELELAYQPIFSLRTGAIAGLEALVRWRHPRRGLVRPDSFIPLAEASGRIHEVGRWVLRAAAHQGSLWRAKYPAMPGIQVGVNVSAAQLREPGLVREVAGALADAQLEPAALTLEITETDLMADLDAASERLHELKALGVQIAIDDFGVGYSSLRYLQRLPLDNLKIAMAFVDEIDDAEAEPAVLRAILDLADVFDLRPVAEGIETPEQRRALLALGCDLGQGHLLSEAIPAARADDLILQLGLLGGAGGSGTPQFPRLSPRPAAEAPSRRRPAPPR